MGMDINQTGWVSRIKEVAPPLEGLACFSGTPLCIPRSCRQIVEGKVSDGTMNRIPKNP